MPKGIQAKGENEGQLIGDVMEIMKNISLCLASFTLRFESYVGRTSPSKDLTQNIHTVWVKKDTCKIVISNYVLALILCQI